jgi:2,5-diamino-6-(ribosylamino)-4(3H)-pyrimidinone 5'-phosphate reductase
VAIQRLIDITDDANTLPADLYSRLVFPSPTSDRPYTVINMVETVDGKTLVGQPGSTAAGLGGPTDQLLMRRIQGCVDAALIGAGTLRTGNVIYRPEMWRAVVTASGDVPLSNRFFTDAPGKAIVFAPESLPDAIRGRLSAVARVETAGAESVDVREVCRILRQNYGVQSLAVEGGGSTNFDFLNAGLIDELFVTVAPKLKGGAHLPTPVDGAGLPDRDFIALAVMSLYRDDDELYLRYRVGARRTP